MSQAVCIVAKAPLRKDSSDQSEMVSELLFGEQITVLEEGEKWTRIQCNWDLYNGWVDPKQITLLAGPFAEKVVLKNALTKYDTNLGTLRLSVGSELGKSADGNYELGEYRIDDLAELNLTNTSFGRNELLTFGKEFLNVPYLWGGRSIFGIDCSGLTQVCFKLCGRSIPRDASDQEKVGIEINDLSEALAGDLAFFANEKGKIIHVGIVFPEDKILHASGKVRIDRLDEKGIFNEDINKYTHHLASLKNLMPS